MPEFRQNLATKEWVILAPQRGKRPSDFRHERSISGPASPYQAECPFCAGNEDQTENPVYVFPPDGQWQVRVVPNKYAALQPQLAATRTRVGSFLAAKGFGVAEVVIEHPRHDLTIATMELSEVINILKAYRQRQAEISRNDRINLITVFRN
ncbi:MAG: galactose-1-phosphate uridylyltransferase, partial [Candidatus Zixiibacteriota bacterium]